MKFGEPVLSESAMYRRLLAGIVAGAIAIATIIAAPPAIDSWALNGADVEASGDGGEPVPPIGIDVHHTKAEAIEPLTMSY